MVAVLDYGVGNVMAIQNIIRKSGGEAVITSDQDSIEQADKIILPGVGSFDYGMQQLHDRGLVNILMDQVVERKKTILGLCLGAQLMTKQSEEGSLFGLGWVKGVTKKFDENIVSTIPHMGWTNVNVTRPNALTNGLEQEARFYFVHSYHFEFTDHSQIVATASYGYEFACAFQLDNIFGVQFHPEKSHRFGVKLFENFLRL